MPQNHFNFEIDKYQIYLGPFKAGFNQVEYDIIANIDCLDKEGQYKLSILFSTSDEPINLMSFSINSSPKIFSLLRPHNDYPFYLDLLRNESEQIFVDIYTPDAPRGKEITLISKLENVGDNS